MSVETGRGAEEGVLHGYAPAPRAAPFDAYAGFTAAFNAAFAGALVAGARSGRLRERIEPGDVVLLGVATQSSAG
jgi:hypothetical protein